MPTEHLKSWAIYCRVSTEEQATEGVSLDAQERSCRGYLETYGHPVGEVFVERGKSGKDLNRPEMKRLMEAVRVGRVAGLCVWKLDRLSRSVYDTLTLAKQLKEANVELVSVIDHIDTSSPGGKFVFHILSALAEMERDQISLRTKTAISYLRTQGCYTGGPVPPGLLVAPRADGRRELQADPQSLAPLAQAWEMARCGSSLLDIGKHLTNGKVPSGAKTGWNKMKVSRLLKNRAYIGRVIEVEVFEAAQVNLGSRASPFKPSGLRQVPKPTERVWLLHGLAVCARCGAALAGRSSKGKKGDLYPYLYCTGRDKAGKGVCVSPDLPAEKWEKTVIKVVAKALRDPEVEQALATVLADAKQRRGPLEDEQKTLRLEVDHGREKIGRVVGMVADGTATSATTKGVLDGLTRQLKVAEGRLAEVEGRLAALVVHATSVDYILSEVRAAADALPEMPPELQARVLQALVEKVYLARGVGEIKIDLKIPLLAHIKETESGKCLPDSVSRDITIGDLDGT